ncbi:uncharacterized protein LOC143373160 [Andrena cerasifolii]|uniref:uncharacterized protein LOC143373160 n=1 Tax=Andrena cerasifolii TaxID=2819439 RepID=UPI0040381CCF
MKKRRPCTWNSYRSTTSPTSLLARELDTFPVKTKSVHDLKRRRLQRCSPKLQKKSAESSGFPLKRDAFGSLESLFDLKKPLKLPEVCSLTVQYHQEGYVSSLDPGNLNTSRNFIESLISQRVDLEPHILERTYEADNHKSKPKEVEEEPIVEAPEVHESRAFKTLIEEELSTMAENDAEIIEEVFKEDVYEISAQGENEAVEEGIVLLEVETEK